MWPADAQAAQAEALLRTTKLPRAVQVRLVRVTAGAVAPPRVCKQAQGAVVPVVRVAALAHPVLLLTDSRVAAVLVWHRVSRALPPCMPAVAVARPQCLGPAAAVAWAVQAAAVLGPVTVVTQ